MYYFVSDGRIVDSSDSHNQDVIEREAQRLANVLEFTVWVIDGQHSGITCMPESPDMADGDKEV